MSTTRVLVPMPQSDKRRQTLQQKAKELRTLLDKRRYAGMNDFLEASFDTGFTPRHCALNVTQTNSSVQTKL